MRKIDRWNYLAPGFVLIFYGIVSLVIGIVNVRLDTIALLFWGFLNPLFVGFAFCAGIAGSAEMLFAEGLALPLLYLLWGWPVLMLFIGGMLVLKGFDS